MTATQQTKSVKQNVRSLGVTVRSDVCGSMVRGPQAELISAAAMLRAAGFDVVWMGCNMINAATK